MLNPMPPRQAWCTSSRSDTRKSSGTDLLLLGEHMTTCTQLHRHLLTLHGVAASAHGFMVTRLVTTLMVLLILFSLGYWML